MEKKYKAATMMQDSSTDDVEDSSAFMQLYASLMILLMTFFIVIYSMSTFSQAKYELAQESLNYMFKKLGIKKVFNIPLQLEKVDEKGDSEKHKKIQISVTDIEQALEDKLNGCTVQITPQKTYITIENDKLFEENGFSISEEGQTTLSGIYEFIRRGKIERLVIKSYYGTEGKSDKEKENWTYALTHARALKEYFSSLGLEMKNILTSAYLNAIVTDEAKEPMTNEEKNRTLLIIYRPKISKEEQLRLYIGSEPTE